MSVYRTRTQSGGTLTGFTKTSGGQVNRTYSTYDRSCYDAVGAKPYVDQGLDLWYRKYSGGLLNGKHGPYTDTNYPVDHRSNMKLPGAVSSVTANSYQQRILAQTGPSTPKVHLPVFMFELRELASMVKGAGDLLLGLAKHSTSRPYHVAGSATLAYQFGWKPLIEDLQKMTNFMEHVAKRQRELDKMKSSGSRGVLRRITLSDTTNRFVNLNVPINTSNGSIYGPTYEENSKKEWATARWRLRDNQLAGKKTTYTEAFKSAFSLDADYIPVNVWKALPWSWFIDWFADISNLMIASRNMLNFQPISICYMCEQHWRLRTDSYRFSGGAVMSPIDNYAERKQRIIVPVTLTGINLKLPFLDSFKLSILGSMTAVRLGR